MKRLNDISEIAEDIEALMYDILKIRNGLVQYQSDVTQKIRDLTVNEDIDEETRNKLGQCIFDVVRWDRLTDVIEELDGLIYHNGSPCSIADEIQNPEYTTGRQYAKALAKMDNGIKEMWENVREE